MIPRIGSPARTAQYVGKGSVLGVTLIRTDTPRHVLQNGYANYNIVKKMACCQAGLTLREEFGSVA
jgi:hypothetical protein